MKKLKFLFLALIVSLLFLSQGFAQTYLFNSNIKLVASGSVTAANTQLSLVDGTAFAYLVGVDLSAYQTGKYLLSVYNSSTSLLIAQGYISDTAPAGETLDAELLTNGNMETGDPPTGWLATTATLDGVADERTGGAGAQSLSITATAANGDAHKNATVVSGALYFIDSWSKMVSGTGSIIPGIDGVVNIANIASTSWTHATLYRVANETTWWCKFRITDNGSEGRGDDFSVKKLLDPPSTGVRIEATPGGAQNWMRLGSGAVNAAITYKIFKVKN